MPGPSRQFSLERLGEALAYDPETGIFTWKINLGNMPLKGTEAGCAKFTSGKNRYRYNRLDGVEMQAARVAWALHVGQWPASRLCFVDRDSLNLRFANLKLQNSVAGKYDLNDPVQRAAYMKAHRAAHPKVWRETHLQRNFGIDLAEYGRLAAKQDNKCAICGCEETARRRGKLKALAVDHDHRTGAVRGLLCNDCNQGIGKLKDDRDVLVSALRYFDKHSGGKTISKLTIASEAGET